MFTLRSMMRDNDSIHIMNKYGDRGSPYLIPREGWKKGVGMPLISMDMDEVVTQDIMRLIKSSGNRKCCSEKCMKYHSKWSKAFSRSILIIIFPFSLFF